MINLPFSRGQGTFGPRNHSELVVVFNRSVITYSTATGYLRQRQFPRFLVTPWRDLPTTIFDKTIFDSLEKQRLSSIWELDNSSAFQRLRSIDISRNGLGLEWIIFVEFPTASRQLKAVSIPLYQLCYFPNSIPSNIMTGSLWSSLMSPCSICNMSWADLASSRRITAWKSQTYDWNGNLAVISCVNEMKGITRYPKWHCWYDWENLSSDSEPPSTHRSI
jgi:hypothetical protein